MIDKKYQIFLSSTYSDLKVAREKVIKTILNLYQHPVGMEMFSADDDEQWEVIKETIKSSDYYIVLIGHRYGSTTKDGISYTEKEYDFAQEIGIPVLAFVRERDVSTKPKERENDPELKKKVDQFVSKATANKMCDFWTTPEDLATKIAVALPKVFLRHKRPGWIRAETDSGNISEELARLSKENNHLRRKLEQLKEEEKKPDLKIRINGQEEITLEKKKFELPSIPSKLSFSDVPDELRDSVREYEINSYNSRIPSKEILEKLEDEYRAYWEINENSNPIKVEVVNTGEAKANSVWLGVDFPKEIQIITKDEFENNSLPSYLEPLEEKNPIEKAREKLEKHFKGTNQSTNNNVIINTPTYDIKDNSLRKSIRKIVHGMISVHDGNYLLIPKETGEFKARVTLMCEQFEDAKEYEFPIKVVEEND